jgi:hypothetical protein
VDVAWGVSRPARPCAPIRVHPLKYAGQTVNDKLHKLKAKVRRPGRVVMMMMRPMMS